ncbi:MAG TPA: InlB B-repeat-containing protein [Candidatus Onthoplasma faecigallinarum]|nr:InlB B-repeat-containing protein [Candidatus Onthoplasma faecigallinarum]
MNKTGVSIISILATIGLLSGGVALNNYFNDKPITLSYGDKTFFGKVESNAGSQTDDSQDVVLDKSLEELNEICRRDNLMMMIVVNTIEGQAQLSAEIIYSADQVEMTLNNTYIQQSIEDNPNYAWKGWSLDPDGKELITDYASIFKNEAVLVYAVAEEAIPYQVQMFNNIFQFKAGADGKVELLPMDMSAEAPEGYTFLGFSTISEIDTENIVNLTEITVEENAIYYAVFVNEDGEAFNYLEEATKVTLNYLEGFDILNFDNYYYNGRYQTSLYVPNIDNADGNFMTFIGWYTESTIADSLDPEKFIEDINTFQPTEDVQLYAVYQTTEGSYVTVNQLSVIKFVWLTEGGESATRYISTTDDLTSATAFANSFVPMEIPENNEFVGWSTVANNPENIVDFSSTSATANATYYAIFQDISLE